MHQLKRPFGIAPGVPAAHPGEHDRLSRFIVTAFPASYAYKTLAFVPKIRL